MLSHLAPARAIRPCFVRTAGQRCATFNCRRCAARLIFDGEGTRMKAADYRGWLERRELTHEAAGRALGVHKSTSKRYGDGSITIPLSIELAIEALEARWRRGGWRGSRAAFVTGSA
jgi:hypothetical protein